MEYFAGLDFDEVDLLKKNRIAGELNARIDAYYNWVLMTNRLSRWRTAYNTYYGQRGTHSSHYVQAAGSKGELSFLMSNEYRNLVQHLLVLATQSRVALETVATNSESKSKAQSYVAKGIVEYYRRDGRVDTNSYNAGEISLIMDSGWVFNTWNFAAQGSDTLSGAVDPDTNQQVRQGDMDTVARGPLDVVIDFTKIDASAHDWRIVRDPVNKFDLAAQYPEMADQITKITRDVTKDSLFRFGDMANVDTGVSSSDIDRWTFYHKRTPALPQGRMLQMVDKVVVFDGPIPYRKLPGNRICPSEQMLSAFGYSNMNDLLSLQDVMDALISAGVSNMTTCGFNNIWVQDPSSLDFDQLAQGFNLMGGGGGSKPEVLQLNRLTPEWFSLTNFIIQRMEAISGINSVARGNTEGKDFSGAAMALLQSMSVQFNSGFQRSMNKLIEDNGNDIIQLTQDFVKEPVMGLIVGENNAYMMKEYSGNDLNLIQRVYCRQSNALENTTAGVLTLADKAMQAEGGVSKGEFAEIIKTGNLDCLLDRDRNLRLAIDQENEALVRGEVPPVCPYDNPFEHMRSHAKVFASPDDRKDAALIQNVKEHEKLHMGAWANMPPAILQILNIPPYQGAPLDYMGNPLPMQPLPMPMPPPQGDGGPAMGAPQQSAPVKSNPKQEPDAQGGPRQPSLPTNPMSGQQWDPATGGLAQGVA